MKLSYQTLQVYKTPALIASMQSFSKKAGITVFLIGCVVITGWIFDITILKSILPGLVSMKANTAICFILSGASLWLWHQKQDSGNRRKYLRGNALACASLVIFISLLTLIEYSFHLNFGIDQLFFKEDISAVSTANPGRMAPNTALNFLLLGSALLLLSIPRPNYRPAQSFTLVAFSIALLGLLGYIYGNAYFYKAGPSYTAIALHTAVAFILLCFGILFADPDKGLMAAVTSGDAGGIMARSLSPAAIVIPPMIGWLMLSGYRSNVYTAEMAISLLGILNIVVFAVLIWWNAKDLGIIDGQRHRAEKALKKANEELENRVEQRTIQLRQTNEQLENEIADRISTEKALRQSEERERQKAEQLELALHKLQQTQAQLIQTEKISSLGQLVAGVAHEINNPINFIYGNINYAHQYTQELMELIRLYQHNYPNPVPEIDEKAEAIELDFLMEDLSKLLSSMKLGAERIREIVLSLRNFSRLDEAEMKSVDIHEGIDSTLLILQHRLKAKPDRPAIEVIKEYGDLPLVECYAGQLNQVFMNLLANAIDALEMGCQEAPKPQIRIHTEKINSTHIAIRISDNGSGITEEVHQKLFDPFFTTKPIGKGTGLGLSISYQIVVEKHGGQMKCISAAGKGAEFVIVLCTSFTNKITSDNIKVPRS
ncbi:sensor histidine kinase [Argonema antarcticum]|uniref:sensor histidine kinase n=1 Tax=Argonema antarcticum TaxID=2942763 RepID=UPI0020139518|nr:ATP-binding protein [Argonema antarcticum]MCL1472263.1 GHKL domain-containing protein [Argonema antarcticum A004/B2]